ncbi:hypothetical protein KGM48_03775 [Patescibacteria group bacterium]|nr:hypothetical protein [Patescibacteria group bacterium]
MITNEDVAKLKGVFATKDDLKHFATKDDLSEAIADVRVEIGEVRDTVDTIAVAVGRIENAIDKLSGNIQDLRIENAAGAAHLERHDRQIEALARETGITIPE